MKIVADESVEILIVQRLRDAGHIIFSIGEESPGIIDDEVLSIANEQNALLLTADKDFGLLVYQTRQDNKGVILYRLHGMTTEEKATLLVSVIGTYAASMLNMFTVITEDRVRIRPLPDVI